jgi:hypothetical protein
MSNQRRIHKGTLSQQFEIHSGFRQDCILTPLQFLIGIDDVLRLALSGNSHEIRCTLNDEWLTHLDYADNISILSHIIVDLVQMAQSKDNQLV